MPSADHTAIRHASRAETRFLVAPKLHLGTPLTAQLRCFAPRPKPSRNPIQWLSQLLPVFLLVAISVRADDLTGMPYDDPKDLSPASTRTASYQSSGLFLPLPSWARGVMPPLPSELKPMGGKTPVAAPPKTAAAPLAPPKETPAPAAPKEDVAEAPKPPAPPAETPAMVTVSPFLQWIKSNPQAAAQARQEANGYSGYNTPSAPSTPNAPPSPNAPGAAHSPAMVNGQPDSGDPYWLPPLIDSPDIVPNVVGGSSAIYSKPQR